jgi:hypothetical protein
MLHLLLERNAVSRLVRCTADSPTEVEGFSTSNPHRATVAAATNIDAANRLCSTLSYDTLRRHAVFAPLSHRLCVDSSALYGRSIGTLMSAHAETQRDTQARILNNLHAAPALKVPSLAELCLRAVGAAAVLVSEATALNGGFRPEIPWIKVLMKLFVLAYVVRTS